MQFNSVWAYKRAYAYSPGELINQSLPVWAYKRVCVFCSQYFIILFPAALKRLRGTTNIEEELKMMKVGDRVTFSYLVFKVT